MDESMSAPDNAAIKRRAFGGVLNMAGREMLIKLLALGGGVALARMLEPATFGLFAVATFIVSVLTLFSELGLGAALIRKPGELDRAELDALFTFQLIFISALAVALFMAAPLVALVYNAPEIVWVVRALSANLLLTSLRTVPLIISERRLAYGPVALADVSGQVAYWLVAVALAASGFGVWSLVFALLSSGAVGTFMLYLRSKWRPRLNFDPAPLRGSMRFGLLYQGQSVVHFMKDTMIPSLGGLAFGGVAVGYLSWARQLASFPLQLTTLVSRVIYPALARLQHDSAAFGELVEMSLRWTTRLTFPALAVLFGFGPQIIIYVYGPRWQPATASLYLLTLTGVFSVGNGVLSPAIYSAGKAGTGLRISLAWMLVTWAMALGLIVAGMGFEAIPAAAAVGAGLALVAMVIEARKLAHINFASAVWGPTVCMVVVSAVSYVAAQYLVRDVWSLLALALPAGCVGVALNVWSDRVWALRAVRSAMSGRLRLSLRGTRA